MTDWKITNESRAAALELMEGFGKVHQAFEMLAVPVGEAGWVEVDPLSCQTARYRKGNYTLARWTPHKEWNVYLNGKTLGQLSSCKITEAQAWADGIIKEREAGEKIIEKSERNRCDDLTCVHCYKQPKRFGPGSEAIMPNGDRVRVIRSSVLGFYAVNLTTNIIEVIDGINSWVRIETLRSTLEAAGAKIL